MTCSKSTYQYVTDNPTSIIYIHRHIKYMKEINLAVPSNMEIGCLSCIKLLLAQGLLGSTESAAIIHHLCKDITCS